MNPYQPFTQSRSFFNLNIKNNNLFDQHSCAEVKGTVITYNPVIERSGFASPFAEKFNCITCMSAYKNKSLEELRWEDYQCNQKGPTPPLQSKSLLPLTQPPSFLNPTNILKNFAFADSKPVNDIFSTKPNQTSEPRFLVEPMPLCSTKSAHNFNSHFNLKPSSQTNFSSKTKDNSFSCKLAPLQSVEPYVTPNLQPPLPTPVQIINTSSTYQNLPVNQNSSNFTSVNFPQALENEFYKHVQKIFQPFPRRDFLANIGANFNMENRTTDPNAINDILNELRASDNKKPNPSTYTPFSLNNVKQSFFEDVSKHVATNKSSRSLILDKKNIFSSTSSSNEFLQNLQISFVKTININYNTMENQNANVDTNINFMEVNSKCQRNCFMGLKCYEEKLGKSVKYIKPLKNTKQLCPKNNTTFTDKLNRCLNYTADVSKPEDLCTNFNALNMIHNFYKITQNNNFSVVEKETQTTQETVEIGDCCKNIKWCNVKLTKADYYTEPPFENLHKYVNADCGCILNDFVIGKRGYGKIHFLDSVNLCNLDLDEIVDIDYRNITVYPDDDKKPTVGEGLNVRAEITIDNVWPLDKSSDTMIMDPEKIMKTNFIDKLRILAKSQNASFVNYLPDTGSWIFNVEHF